MQKSLFPTKLVIEQPYSGHSTKLKYVGFDQQDRKYAVRINTPEEPEAPLTEWICYNICELLGIPHPDFDQVVRVNGEVAFGSRWDESALQLNASELTENEVILMLIEAKEDVNCITSLDQFLPNHDRHIGNYLFRKTARATRALAFDWSQSLLFDPWPAKPGSSTINNWSQLRHLLHDAGTLRSTIDLIKSIDSNTFEAILSSSHPSWSTATRREQLLNWWSNFSHSRADDTARALGI